MPKRPSLLTNTFYQGLSSLTNLFLLALLVLAGRYLGGEGYGKFSFALAFVVIFEPIVDPGLSQIILREIARDISAAQKHLSNVLAYKLRISLFFYLFLVFVAFLIQIPQDTFYAVAILTIAGLLKSFKGTFCAVLEAHERFGLHALSSVIERALLLAVGSFVLIKGGGLIALCWTFTLVRILDLMILILIVRLSICKVSLEFQLSFFKILLKESLPLGFFSIIALFYNYIDTIMISMMRGDVETGLYNAAFRIYEGLAIIPMTLAVAFMPRLSHSYQHEEPYFLDLILRGLKYVIVIAAPVFVCGILLSEKVVQMLFGVDYIPSILPLKILLSGIIFMFLLTFLQIILISMNNQKRVLYCAIVGLTLNVILNFAMIPHFGYIGASFVTVFSEFVVCVLLFLYLYKQLDFSFLAGVFAKVFTAILIPIVIIKHILVIISPITQSVLLLNLYLLLLLSLRIFNKEELSYLVKYVK